MIAVTVEDFKSLSVSPKNSFLEDEYIIPKIDSSEFEGTVSIAYINHKMELIVLKVFRDSKELKSVEVSRLHLK